MHTLCRAKKNPFPHGVSPHTPARLFFPLFTSHPFPESRNSYAENSFPSYREKSKLSPSDYNKYASSRLGRFRAIVTIVDYEESNLMKNQIKNGRMEGEQISMPVEWIDIRYVVGTDNKVADALSRVEIDAITKPPTMDYKKFAQSQLHNTEVKSFFQPDSSIKLQKQYFPLEDVFIYCDMSLETPRPFVPKDLRQEVFENLHFLSHPGI
ncbi:hypothetical protein AVEN_251413-1 [Araneus ventricosus]|uniref:Uncharacterized protein n=1 Tax=Araneus ventricosus TaxID=182803 RepID=A0A4Y2L289_ARAVE|nr:hypothetical protein AVEN_251413-1 [Araneus ventricosus]